MTDVNLINFASPPPPVMQAPMYGYGISMPRKKMGLGTKVLIGAGLAAAGYATYKGLKKYGNGSAKAGASKVITNIKSTAKQIFKPEEPKKDKTSNNENDYSI
jgi:uncharacterized membrane protein YebE (DUF533 family)